MDGFLNAYDNYLLKSICNPFVIKEETQVFFDLNKDKLNFIKLTEFALKHGVGNYLYKFLKPRGVSFYSGFEDLRNNFYQTQLAAQNSISQINTIANLIEPKDLILLKGAADIYTGENNYRQMGDIDILVSKNDYNNVLSVLKGVGFQSLRVFQSDFVKKQVLHYNEAFKHKKYLYPVEVHFALNARYDNNAIDIERFLLNRRKVQNNVYVLDDFNRLEYACLHFFKHLQAGEVRYNQLVDILSLYKKIKDRKKDISGIALEVISGIMDYMTNGKDEDLTVDFQKSLKMFMVPKYFKLTKNYNYYKKLSLVPGVLNKIRYLTHIVFPDKKYLDFHKISYFKYLKSQIRKVF